MATFGAMKNWKKSGYLALLSSGFLAVIPVKCNSIFEKSKPGADDGYEYVTVVGSMVPQRVKKGDAADGSSSVSTMSAEQFDKMRQRLQNGIKSQGGS
jgi:hypothetical protein